LFKQVRIDFWGKKKRQFVYQLFFGGGCGLSDEQNQVTNEASFFGPILAGWRRPRFSYDCGVYP
jgi:hypothetical protein